MKTAALVAGVLTGALVLASCGGRPLHDASGTASGDAVLGKAFTDHATDLEVEGAGTVVRILSDDDDGSRHQRFIVRLESGQTLLMAHNIDIAPRVEDLAPGDRITFRGVYEWSAEGGTIHWTHGDPGGGHASGWIRHGGVQYD